MNTEAISSMPDIVNTDRPIPTGWLPCGLCWVQILAGPYSPVDGEGNPICMLCSHRYTLEARMEMASDDTEVLIAA